MVATNIYLVLYLVSCVYFWYATTRQCYSAQYRRYVPWEEYRWLTPCAILACTVSGVALWLSV